MKGWIALLLAVIFSWNGVGVLADAQAETPEVPATTGEYLVRAESKAQAREIASRHGYILKAYRPYSKIAVLEANSANMVLSAVPEADENISFFPNYRMRLSDTTEQTTDPKYEQQYFHAETGSDIVRQYTKGDGVMVAVIDTGVDTDHPDLAENLSPLSYNAYTGKVGINEVAYNVNFGNTGHGTHVAGIIAAVQGNNQGGCGIAPEAELMIIRADYEEDVTVDGVTTTEWMLTTDVVAEGIFYAVEHGADIINMSVGVPYESFYGMAYHEENPLYLAVEYAVQNGVLLVAAAGNASVGHADYPAAYEPVLAVSALKTGAVFDDSYSNYGSEIDISAPGTAIYSTYPDNRYVTTKGTSMASPMVAGAAALLLAARPWLTAAELKSCLCNGAQERGDAGWDQYYGNGSLYVPGAFKAAALLYPSSLSITGNRVTISNLPIDAVVLVAGYDGQERLDSADTADIKGAGHRNMSFDLQFDADSVVETVKVFLFDSLNNLMPLCADVGSNVGSTE